MATDTTPTAPAEGATAAPAASTAPAAPATTAPAEGQQPATGAPAAEPPKEPERTREEWVALSREKAARVAAERAAKEAAEKAKAWEEFRTKGKEDPLAVLREAGFESLDSFLEAALPHTRELTAEEKQAKELADIKAKLAERERLEAEAQQKAQETQAQHLRANNLAITSQVLQQAGKYAAVLAKPEYVGMVYDELTAKVQAGEMTVQEITPEKICSIADGYRNALVQEVKDLYSKDPTLFEGILPPAAPASTNAPAGQPTKSGPEGNGSVTGLASRAISGAAPPEQRKQYSPEELRQIALRRFQGSAA